MPVVNKLSAVIAVLFVCVGGTIPSAWSASFALGEYQALFDSVNRNGFVRVLVGLDVEVPLEPAERSAAVQAQLAAREDALLAELGDNALQMGLWKNGLGQMSVYVNAAGLRQLTESTNVRTFGLDATDGLRTGVYDGDGRLNRIASEIERNGYANVEVALNLENFEFDFRADGQTVLKSSAAQQAEIEARFPAFLATLPQEGALNLDSLKTSAAQAIPLLRITRKGLFALKEHAEVRALRRVDDAPEPFWLDPEALEAARNYGSADVIIDLRRPAGYSPLRGKLPARAWQSQAAALRRVVAEVLSALDPEAARQAQYFDGLPSASVRLSESALERLRQAPDPRLWRVQFNKPTVEPVLAQSTAWINLPQAWDQGYTASGQRIVVYDTGFEKTHPFLLNDLGQPKVIFEACFGTNGISLDDGLYYHTLCPNPDANGDSPLGQPGSAAANCTGSSLCFHGTFVAGIAAGRRGWSGLSGVAPGAEIVAVKTFSSSGFPFYQLDAFPVDIIAGVQALVQNAGSGEFTANLSLGGGQYFSTCSDTNPPFADLVAQLYSLKIPVVAATGNDGWSTSIAWPACAPHVIKVAASFDISDSLWASSNLINPLYVVGPVLLAPGCNITSATLGGGVRTACGTSAATPHVAGLYAAIKAAAPGITVAAASAWILAHGVDIVTPGGYTLKRIHVPNL